MPNVEAQIKFVRDATSSYQETVHTIIAFSALICHDGQAPRPGSCFGIGRKMLTSAANRIRPTEQITPDIVAQRSATYGVVVEVKKSMPENQRLWVRAVDQLLKYDDNLVGWETANEQIAASDAVLLIHQSRSRAFVAYMTQLATTDATKRVANGAVIEFNRSNESAPYIFFRREGGTIRDAGLSGQLQNGQQIPVEKVLLSYPSLKYYDAEPPYTIMAAQLRC